MHFLLHVKKHTSGKSLVWSPKLQSQRALQIYRIYFADVLQDESEQRTLILRSCTMFVFHVSFRFVRCFFLICQMSTEEKKEYSLHLQETMKQVEDVQQLVRTQLKCAEVVGSMKARKSLVGNRYRRRGEAEQERLAELEQQRKMMENVTEEAKEAERCRQAQFREEIAKANEDLACAETNATSAFLALKAKIRQLNIDQDYPTVVLNCGFFDDVFSVGSHDGGPSLAHLEYDDV